MIRITRPSPNPLSSSSKTPIKVSRLPLVQRQLVKAQAATVVAAPPPLLNTVTPPKKSATNPSDIDPEYLKSLCSQLKEPKDLSGELIDNVKKMVANNMADDKAVSVNNIYMSLSLVFSLFKLCGIETAILSLILGQTMGTTVDMWYKIAKIVSKMKLNTQTDNDNEATITWEEVAFGDVKTVYGGATSFEGEDIKTLNAISKGILEFTYKLYNFMYPISGGKSFEIKQLYNKYCARSPVHRRYLGI